MTHRAAVVAHKVQSRRRQTVYGLERTVRLLEARWPRRWAPSSPRLTRVLAPACIGSRRFSTHQCRRVVHWGDGARSPPLAPPHCIGRPPGADDRTWQGVAEFHEWLGGWVCLCHADTRAVGAARRFWVRRVAQEDEEESERVGCGGALTFEKRANSFPMCFFFGKSAMTSRADDGSFGPSATQHALSVVFRQHSWRQSIATFFWIGAAGLATETDQEEEMHGLDRCRFFNTGAAPISRVCVCVCVD